MRTITQQFIDLQETLVKVLLEEDYDKNRMNLELTERIQSFVQMILLNQVAIIEVKGDRSPAAIVKAYHAIIKMIQESVGDLFWDGIQIQDPEDPKLTHSFDLVCQMMDITDIITERFGDLSPIVTSEEIDNDIALYLKEAHGAYRLGMNKAAILLAHAAVELQARNTIFAIDSDLFYNSPHPSLRHRDKDIEMKQMRDILEAQGVITPEISTQMKQLSMKRNAIAHRDPETQEFEIELPVKDLINSAGEIILHLINSSNG